MAGTTTGKPISKSAMFQSLAEATGLSRKQIASVFDELVKLIKRDVGKKGPGVFALPGLLKIKRVNKPATKARQGRNPATGEPMMIKAKPARTIVKAQPLKNASFFHSRFRSSRITSPRHGRACPGLSRPSTSYWPGAEERRGCPRHQRVHARLRRVNARA